MNHSSELFVAILPEKAIQLIRGELHQDFGDILIEYRDPPDYRQMAPRPPPRFV
jgi:hypothetical protein